MDKVAKLGEYKDLELMLDGDDLTLIATNKRTFLSCYIDEGENMKDIAPPLFKAWEIFNAGSLAMQEAGLTMKELNSGIAVVANEEEAKAVQLEAKTKMAAGESIETQPGVHIIATRHGYVTVIDKDKASPEVQATFENDHHRYHNPNE